VPWVQQSTLSRLTRSTGCLPGIPARLSAWMPVGATSRVVPTKRPSCTVSMSGSCSNDRFPAAAPSRLTTDVAAHGREARLRGLSSPRTHSTRQRVQARMVRQPRRPARRSSVGLMAQRALHPPPRPMLNRRADGTKDAAPAPRPTLNRRADGTKGAAPAPRRTHPPDQPR